MTLGEHEAVAVGIVRVLRVNAHVIEEDAGHQLHRGQRTAGVAAAGVGGHRDDVARTCRQMGESSFVFMETLLENTFINY